MKKTLILYESEYEIVKKVYTILSFILGPAKLCNIEENTDDINQFENLLIVLPLDEGYSVKNIIKYFKHNNFDTEQKRVSIVTIGLSKEDGIKYALEIKDIIHKNDIYYYFIYGDFNNIGKLEDKKTMNAAIKIKEYFENPKKEAPKEMIKKEILNFIKDNNTCTICTGYDNFIRATPIEYKYFQDEFYFISEGGLKFIGILNNRNISICIYEKYTSTNNLKGLQITGDVEILEPWSSEYEKALKLNKVNIENLKRLNISMHIFKVNPKKYEFLNSEFKKLGYDSKQIYINQIL